MGTIRSLSKRHVTNNGNRDTESTSLESCGKSLVCGHAYYDSSFTITSYRRSNRCICEEDHRCVLTNNLSDRKAYVFKCRSINQSENMFPFPDNPHHWSWSRLSAKVFQFVRTRFSSPRFAFLLSTSIFKICKRSIMILLTQCIRGVVQGYSTFLILFNCIDITFYPCQNFKTLSLQTSKDIKLCI